MIARQSKFPFATLLLSALTVALWLLPTATTALQYDRTAIQAGQYWRLLTCHLTHFSKDHLLWDTAAFTILAALCEQRSRAKLLLCLTTSALTISAAIWLILPTMQTYRGLSGIDSALFTFLALKLLHQKTHPANQHWLAPAITATLVLFLTKIAYELFSNQTLFVNSSAARMVPVPLAHLVGALAGIFCATEWRTPHADPPREQTHHYGDAFAE